MTTRICTKCKEEKEATLEFFGPFKTNKLNLRAKCRKCTSKDYKKWAASTEAREAKKISIKKYSNSDKGKIAYKRYRESDKGKIVSKKANLKYQLKLASGPAIKIAEAREAKKIASKKYRDSDKGKLRLKKYRASNKGKSACKKAQLKYQLKLKSEINDN